MAATADDAAPAAASAHRPRLGRLGRGWVLALIIGVGFVLTSSATAASWTIDQRNEHRLLTVQTRQAAALIGSAVVNISAPLLTAAQVAVASDGRPAAFAQSLQAAVGPRDTFVMATLLKAAGQSFQPVASVGVKPLLSPESRVALSFATEAMRSKKFAVMSVTEGSQQRIAYALADPARTGFVVYAERAIPANRQVSVESDSAFADLRFATYLGRQLDDRSLATTNLSPEHLPIRGYTVREEVPLGDTVVTLVAGARGHLGGSLARDLPWILLGVGVLLTLGSAFLADQLMRRSRAAETDAAAIAGLYEEVATLYQRERSTAETLQHALLPQELPRFAGLETASRYVAGAAGVDVGGDWFSLLPVDEEHFAFVVGDVSGRGVSAASIMAGLRYTLSAYLSEGHPPEVALQKCAAHIDIEVDDHFATVLVGTAALQTREIRLASAGHLPPLLIAEDGSAVFLETPTQLPLGIAAERYSAATFTVPLGATLLCFTDGLVERRGESLDDGLRRLAGHASGPVLPVEAMVDQLLSLLSDEGAEDDTAMLALRWTAPIPLARRIAEMPILDETK